MEASKATKKLDVAIELVGQVPCGGSHLSEAVRLQRLIDNKRNGNYASALLADGTILVAHADQYLHSEEYLLQAAADRKIVAVYSEREPCNTGHRCASQLEAAGIKNVSWSFKWNDIGDAGRDETTKQIAAEIKKLFNQ